MSNYTAYIKDTFISNQEPLPTISNTCASIISCQQQTLPLGVDATIKVGALGDRPHKSATEFHYCQTSVGPDRAG